MEAKTVALVVVGFIALIGFVNSFSDTLDSGEVLSVVTAYLTGTNISNASLLIEPTVIGDMNFITPNASITLYSEHYDGESLVLYGLTPISKPYLAWFSWDEATQQTRRTGWMGCHYNLTNGDVHSHCSIETLDNSSGTPTLNSKFEVSYNGSQTRANIKFPLSDVQFLSEQKLYFGDNFGQAWLQHNGTTGDLELKSNADILMHTHIDLYGNDIKNIDDMFSAGDISMKPTTTFRVFANGQTNRNFLIGDDGSYTYVQAQGTTKIRLLENIDVSENLDVTKNITGNLIYGQMFYYNMTATSLNFAVANVFYNMTFNNATSNGVDFVDAEDYLIPRVAGAYHITYTVIGSGQNNHVYRATVGVNGVPRYKCSSLKKMSAGGDIVSMSGSCIEVIPADAVVKLMVQDVGGTGTGDYYGGSFSLIALRD